MSKSPTPVELYNLISTLNWSGHVELPQEDIAWIARELAGKLAFGQRANAHRCSECGEYKEIVVLLGTSNFCESCLDSAQAEAEETREMLGG